MYEHSGFVLKLILDETVIKLHPDFKDFEEVMLKTYELMLDAISVVPRVESTLYTEWVPNGPQSSLCVCIHPSSSVAGPMHLDLSFQGLY